MSQHAHRRAQNVHRADVSGNLVQQRDQGLRQVARPPQPRLEVLKLRPIGQIAVQEQKRRFLERRVCRQVLDAITTILEDACSVSALDIRDRRLAGDHALQTRMVHFLLELAHAGILPSRGSRIEPEAAGDRNPPGGERDPRRGYALHEPHPQGELFTPSAQRCANRPAGRLHVASETIAHATFFGDVLGDEDGSERGNSAQCSGVSGSTAPEAGGSSPSSMPRSDSSWVSSERSRTARPSIRPKK